MFTEEDIYKALEDIAEEEKEVERKNRRELVVICNGIDMQMLRKELENFDTRVKRELFKEKRIRRCKMNWII